MLDLLKQILESKLLLKELLRNLETNLGLSKWEDNQLRRSKCISKRIRLKKRIKRRKLMLLVKFLIFDDHGFLLVTIKEIAFG